MDQRRFPLPLMRWEPKENAVGAVLTEAPGCGSKKRRKSIRQPPKPPLKLRRGLKACVLKPSEPLSRPRNRVPLFFSFGPCTARFLFLFGE